MPRSRLVKKVATILVLALAAFLLTRVFKGVSLADVRKALGEIPPNALARALGLTALSYGMLSLCDVQAVRYLRYEIPRKSAALISFVSYAFNFSFGVLLGGFGVRYRLYSKLGLTAVEVAKVSLFVVSASAVSFALIAGIAHLTTSVEVPRIEWLPFESLKPLAWLELAGMAGFVILCLLFPGAVRIGKWRCALPDFKGLRDEMLPFVAQWLIMAGVLWSVLPQAAETSYLDVLAIQMLASIAALLAHVPAGLGAFEATLLVMLPQLAREQVLAVVICYRTIYHLVPLLVAGTCLLLIEQGRMLHAPVRTQA